MGKGHKDRRREKRARELEEQSNDERLLKDELAEENEKKLEEIQSTKKQNEEPTIPEKPLETSSDTDSGHGSSIRTSTESPKTEVVEKQNRRALIKGLHNIGNTCFFNVIIQSLAHSSLLMDSMYQVISLIMEENGGKYSATTTAQLMKVFDEFTSSDRKKPSIDPKPLFNSLIQKVPSYKGYDQHDTHELFMNLMLILRAEEAQLRHLKPRTSIQSENDDEDQASKMFCLIGCSEPYTTYDKLFGGHLLDVITCQKCTKSLMKIEPFLGLLLPLTDRMSPSENYRNRRKRDDYTGTKVKKEPKILSRKQQKALKKQEKRNSRKGTTGTSGRIKGRQAAKNKTVQEQLPLDEPSSPPPTEEIETNDSTDIKTQDPLPEEQANVEDKPNEEKSADEENEGPDDDGDDDVDNEDAEEEEEEEETQPKGPLTAVESTYILSDMVSKLTLIHETSSRPLPFVDQIIAEKFLNCSNIRKTSVTTDENESIKTLDQCFQRYFKPETLTGENLFDCYYCRSLDPTQKKVLTEATRQTVFFQLPPILPVFLKRFQMYGARSEKINRFIEFPLRLDLTNRCSTQVTSTSAVYSLYAVIEHSGTLRSGHYIAYIKQTVHDNDLIDKVYSQPIDCLLANRFRSTTDEQCQPKDSTNKTVDPSSAPSAWYYISDNTIHKVPESKVLEADAYVLFYQRI